MPVEEAGADDEQDDDGDDDELAARLLFGLVVLLGDVGGSEVVLALLLAVAGVVVASLAAAVLIIGCDLDGPMDLRGLWLIWSAPLVLARLLSSEIIFVVGLRDAEGTRQRELGDVVLVERADVLIVGLLGLRLGLRDGQIVGDAGVEALLGLAEGFVGELDIRAGGLDELGGGLDIEEAVADVLIDLLDLVGEAGVRLFDTGRRRRPFRRGSWRSGGWARRLPVAVKVPWEWPGVVPMVAVVAADVDHGKLVGEGGVLLRRWRT